MRFSQSFKMALRSVSAKKMRSFLTMLGIIIGVASVVIMVSVIQGQNKKNLEYANSTPIILPFIPLYNLNKPEKKVK